MGAWATGAWATGAWQGTAWAAGASVTVPDVVGLSQAAAVSAIEAEGLTASVTTGYSDTVPVGDVISQNPAAGASAASGSAVVIVVSLGEAPEVLPRILQKHGFWPRG
jgi:beta-lactam-binding protein with PASTA domain